MPCGLLTVIISTHSFIWALEKQSSLSVVQALSQNAELRTRLNRIHSESVLTEQVVSVNIISTPDEVGHCGQSVTDRANF